MVVINIIIIIIIIIIVIFFQFLSGRCHHVNVKKCQQTDQWRLLARERQLNWKSSSSSSSSAVRCG